MLKAEIKKEIIMTNKEIAQFLLEDGSFLDAINETLEDMLFDKYKMDYEVRADAIAELTIADYYEILISLANKLLNEKE